MPRCGGTNQHHPPITLLGTCWNGRPPPGHQRRGTEGALQAPGPHIGGHRLRERVEGRIPVEGDTREGPDPDRERPRGCQAGLRAVYLVEAGVPHHRVAALVGVAAAGGFRLHGGCSVGWRGPEGVWDTRGTGGRCFWGVRSDCCGGCGCGHPGEGPRVGGGREWREGVDAAGGAGKKSVSPAGQPVRNAESCQEISPAG